MGKVDGLEREYRLRQNCISWQMQRDGFIILATSYQGTRQPEKKSSHTIPTCFNSEGTNELSLDVSFEAFTADFDKSVSEVPSLLFNSLPTRDTCCPTHLYVLTGTN